MTGNENDARIDIGGGRLVEEKKGCIVTVLCLDMEKGMLRHYELHELP